MNVWVISVPLIGVVIGMVSHIVIMSRWSGKVDANLTQIMKQPSQWATDLNVMTGLFRAELAALRAEISIKHEFTDKEVQKLRDLKHDNNAAIMRLEVLLLELQRRMDLQGK